MQNTRPEYTTIAELAARFGASVPCAANLPVNLDDPDSVWFIDQGAVNLFLVEFKDGVEQAAPQHLLRRESGWLLPGVAPDRREGDEDTTLSLIAKGLPGTVLKRLPASLLSQVRSSELAEQADTWLTAITETLSRFASPLPRPTALAEPGLTQTLAPCTLSVRRGVVWVSETAARRKPVHGYCRPGGTCGGGRPSRSRYSADADKLAHLVRRGEADGRIYRNTGRARHAAAVRIASFHAVAFTLERLNRRLVRG